MSDLPTRHSKQPIAGPAWLSLGLLVVVALIICREQRSERSQLRRHTPESVGGFLGLARD